MSQLTQSIAERLQAQLSPSGLRIEDESAQHAGHAGARSGGGHLRVRVVCERFAGLSPLERHRLVYAALAGEMGARVHALALETLTPAEDAASGE